MYNSTFSEIILKILNQFSVLSLYMHGLSSLNFFF